MVGPIRPSQNINITPKNTRPNTPFLSFSGQLGINGMQVISKKVAELLDCKQGMIFRGSFQLSLLCDNAGCSSQPFYKSAQSVYYFLQS